VHSSSTTDIVYAAFRSAYSASRLQDPANCSTKLLVLRTEDRERNGGEPWTQMMAKLRLRATSLLDVTRSTDQAVQRRLIKFVKLVARQDHLRRAITRGPRIDRIFAELPNVLVRDHVWPKVLSRTRLPAVRKMSHPPGGQRSHANVGVRERANEDGNGVRWGPSPAIQVIEAGEHRARCRFAGIVALELGAEVLRVSTGRRTGRGGAHG